MKTLVFATISISKVAGGVEKNIVLLANFFSNKSKVILITLDNDHANSFFKLSKNVIWLKVGNSKPHEKISFIQRVLQIFKIRKILFGQENLTLVCFHHGILIRFYLASLGIKKRIICSERNSLSFYKHIKANRFSLNFFLLTFVDQVTVQFKSYIKQYPIWIRPKIIEINNPVSPQNECAKINLPDTKKRFNILCVGRLCEQKNQKLLIEAFAHISNQFSDWDLYILGEGPLYKSLLDLIKKLKLESRIFLRKPVKNIRKYYLKSHIFSMPSLWEGFPNALAEAMSFGIPAIGLKSCDGVNNLISHNKTGFLCNTEDFENALKIMIQSTQLRKKLGANSIEMIRKFNEYDVLKKWEALLIND